MVKVGRLLTMGAATAGIAGALIAVPSTPAAAAHPVKRCTGTDSCYVTGTGFRGGTLAVDVDAIGGRNVRLQWTIRQDGFVTCQTTFMVNDPARSWVCNGLGASNSTTLEVADFGNTHNWSLGLRY